MNTLTITLSLIVLSCVTVRAQMVEFPLVFTNTTPIEKSTFRFTFAAHPNGTNELDTQLSEREIPPFPPPAGVFQVHTIPPTEEYMWFSPKDVRMLKHGQRFRESYDVNILWTGGTLEVTWPNPLPQLVDSAYIVDSFTEFPDNFIKVKIEPGTSYKTTNSAITRLILLVWYNGTTSDVADVQVGKLFTLYPNPANDLLTLASDGDECLAQIYNLYGNLVRSISITSPVESMDVSDLDPGLYTVRVSRDGRISSNQSFIRQ